MAVWAEIIEIWAKDGASVPRQSSHGPYAFAVLPRRGEWVDFHNPYTDDRYALKVVAIEHAPTPSERDETEAAVRVYGRRRKR